MSRWIDADALKEDVARLHVLNDEAEIRRAYEYNPHVTSTDFEETLVSVFDAIDDAPSIDIEPKRGEWVLSSDGYGYIGNPVYKCSVCGWWDEQTPYNFCPNCGADMREREGSDDEPSRRITKNV